MRNHEDAAKGGLCSHPSIMVSRSHLHENTQAFREPSGEKCRNPSPSPPKYVM